MCMYKYFTYLFLLFIDILFLSQARDFPYIYNKNHFTDHWIQTICETYVISQHKRNRYYFVCQWTFNHRRLTNIIVWGYICLKKYEFCYTELTNYGNLLIFDQHWWQWCLPRSSNSLTSRRFRYKFRYVIFKLNSIIHGWGISCKIAFRWMSLEHTDGKSTLV